MPGGARHGFGTQFVASPDACWHFQPAVPWPVTLTRWIPVHACDSFPHLISPTGTATRTDVSELPNGRVCWALGTAQICTFRIVMLLRFIIPV